MATDTPNGYLTAHFSERKAAVLAAGELLDFGLSTAELGIHFEQGTDEKSNGATLTFAACDASAPVKAILDQHGAALT